ncbi:MAG: hypothetical protein QME81_02590 [bacterium]|nr:hypothetical protein [bacterium]
MQALILSEYKGGENSIGPSTKLLGVKLLDRLVLSLKGNGVRDIVITSDPQKEIIRAYMDDEKYGCQIKYTYLKGGNGLSLVLKAREQLEGAERFLFTTANCGFYYRTVKTFLTSQPEAISTLGGYPRLSARSNLERAIKVKTDPEGYVLQIDRNMADYNLIEIGLFCFTHEIFDALTEAASNGSINWMDGVNILARKRRLKAVPIKEGYWHKIERKKDLESAQEDLVTSQFP